MRMRRANLFRFALFNTTKNSHLILIEMKISFYMLYPNNSNFTNFLHSDWLFGRLYTSIKAMRKNTQFLPLRWRDVTG